MNIVSSTVVRVRPVACAADVTCESVRRPISVQSRDRPVARVDAGAAGGSDVSLQLALLARGRCSVAGAADSGPVAQTFDGWRRELWCCWLEARRLVPWTRLL